MEGYIKLERGFATILPPGIDVPFLLLSVPLGWRLPFHACMLISSYNDNITSFLLPTFEFLLQISTEINPSNVGKFIPNLIAEPFHASCKYAQIIYICDQTTSPKPDKVLLKKWEQDKWLSKNRQQLVYIIPVELLAYKLMRYFYSLPSILNVLLRWALSRFNTSMAPSQALKTFKISFSSSLKELVDETHLSKS